MASVLSQTVEELNRQRERCGFLTVGELLALTARGNIILDPFSTLISASCKVGGDNVFYPQVVLEARCQGQVTIGNANRFFPQTLFLADQGRIEVGHQNIFGEGGVTIKTAALENVLAVGNAGRYNQGAVLSGTNWLGSGSQVLGAITVQGCRLGAGESYQHPDPDLRGGVLKGLGIARGLVVERGEVVSSRIMLLQREGRTPSGLPSEA